MLADPDPRKPPNAAPLPWIFPRAAYVHIPFCARRCGYCDFAVVAGKDSWIDAYLDALEAELNLRLKTVHPVGTLFLGGGTPTHLDLAPLSRLVEILARWLPVNPGGEFSIEANPESFSREKAALLSRAGVHRVSLGAQSFQTPLLQFLDREHDAGSIYRAVDHVRDEGMTVSLDLIFAVPGQTMQEWQEDLGEALRLNPEHLSTYGLTYEKGTPLWKNRERGRLQVIKEDLELEMYECGIKCLQEKGYEQYEISNFALPGHRSRHNQVYWANEAYHGFGLGAARYVDGVREVNTRDLKGYVNKARAGQSVTQHSEKLGPRERALETLAIQLRRMDGVHRQGFQEQTGFSVEQISEKELSWLIDEGFLLDHAGSLFLSPRGIPVADAIITRLLMETPNQAW